MKKLFSIVPRWFPAILIMAVIFYFSSQPGDNLPDFASWDRVFKKSGHMLGYGLLALSYFHWMKYDKKRYWFAWLLAVAFAVTDEFHQSFVAGRNASIFDVMIFDGLGAAFSLLTYYAVHRASKQG